VVETRHIESANQIKPSWLRGKKKIGVTAGASTPDEAIDEIISKLKKLTSA
jgi:4-hydroxy-3-methylbut-2-enyl diphosphate reductase IspH